MKQNLVVHVRYTDSNRRGSGFVEFKRQGCQPRRYVPCPSSYRRLNFLLKRVRHTEFWSRRSLFYYPVYPIQNAEPLSWGEP